LSSKILRGAPVEEAPVVIENAFELPFEAEVDEVPPQLVEELQNEHPDAAPYEIEDAINEAMDQLRAEPPQTDLELPSEEAGGLAAEDPFADFDASAISDAALEGQSSEEPLEALEDPFAPTAATSPDVLDDARREAQQILAEADERAAEIERAAYEKGYEEGVTAGRASGEEQGTEMLKQAVSIVDRATELHDTMLREAEPEVVALSLEIARKVIQTELTGNPEVVTSVLTSAVSKINGSPRVTVKVNPEQVDAVRAHWDATFGEGYREKEWVIEGDDSVPAGGCVLDTKYGSIDARIGTQFSEIQKTFALLLGEE
jgi:flagellar assembly protein FliH